MYHNSAIDFHCVENFRNKVAEYNQLKVINAFQKNKVADVHFNGSSGYGYNDIGRDTLEKVYADVFNTEAALALYLIVSSLIV